MSFRTRPLTPSRYLIFRVSLDAFFIVVMMLKYARRSSLISLTIGVMILFATPLIVVYSF